MAVKNLFRLVLNLTPEQIETIDALVEERRAHGEKVSRNQVIRELLDKALADQQIDIETAIKYSAMTRKGRP